MNIGILKTVLFDLPQSDKAVLKDAMIILDNCANDCRNQAELTEDFLLKATLENCAVDFENAASQITDLCFTIEDGIKV